MRLRHRFIPLQLTAWRIRYHAWDRWRHGSLLDGPIGEEVKVHFTIDEPDGPVGESLWAERVERECYKLKNNGLFVPVAEGDIIKAKVKWPYLEAVEMVDRARDTWALHFDPEPTDAEAKAIAEAVCLRGGRPEWWMRSVLSVAVGLADDPRVVCRDVLGPGVELD